MKIWVFLGVVALLAFAFVPGTSRGDDGAGAADIDGSTRKITWGDHWAGPKVRSARGLEGKVVLLKIWGG